jgi:hypothetical protein
MRFSLMEHFSPYDNGIELSPMAPRSDTVFNKVPQLINIERMPFRDGAGTRCRPPLAAAPHFRSGRNNDFGSGTIHSRAATASRTGRLDE